MLTLAARTNFEISKDSRNRHARQFRTLYRDSMRMSGVTSKQFKGTACLGWIPYADSVEATGSQSFIGYAGTGYRNKVLCTVLFFLGNPVPEDNPSSLEGFRQILLSKEYRGAISLHNIELTRHPNGKVDVRVDPLESDEQVGFTPYRMPGLFRRWVFWDRGRQERDGMQNTPSYQVALDGSVSISHEVRFKIGKLGDFGSWLLTGYWAAYARIRISYAISGSNYCSVRIVGSGIPSQTIYLDWSRLHFYNMLDINGVELIQFLRSGSGLAPLVFEHMHSWQE
jgi:hypothetical protein